MNPPLKRCVRCGEEKPLAEFPRNRTSKDGHHHYCKTCKNEFARGSYQRHREHALAYQEQYRAEHPEKSSEVKRKSRLKKLDLYKARDRAHYDANREQILAYSRRYHKQDRQQNPDKYRARARRYKAQNPDKVRQHNHIRRARRLGDGGRHTASDIQRQYRAQKGRCYYCQQQLGDTYHVDHVIPISRGGSNGPENIVIACPACNLSKANKMPHEWDGNGGHLL